MNAAPTLEPLSIAPRGARLPWTREPGAPAHRSVPSSLARRLPSLAPRVALVPSARGETWPYGLPPSTSRLAAASSCRSTPSASPWPSLRSPKRASFWPREVSCGGCVTSTSPDPTCRCVSSVRPCPNRRAVRRGDRHATLERQLRHAPKVVPSVRSWTWASPTPKRVFFPDPLTAFPVATSGAVPSAPGEVWPHGSLDSTLRQSAASSRRSAALRRPGRPLLTEASVVRLRATLRSPKRASCGSEELWPACVARWSSTRPAGPEPRWSCLASSR